MKKIFVIDGPSGCGKTTVALELEKICKENSYICSSTKRKKRPEEIDGKEHFFLSEDEFDRKKKNKDFLGHYRMYFNEYGIDKEKILNSLHKNIIITYHINEGTIRKDIENLGIEYTTILILPDDASTLESRIIRRDNSIKQKEVESRLDKYKELLSYKDKYDHVFFNYENKLQDLINDINEVLESKNGN